MSPACFLTGYSCDTLFITESGTPMCQSVFESPICWLDTSTSIFLKEIASKHRTKKFTPNHSLNHRPLILFSNQHICGEGASLKGSRQSNTALLRVPEKTLWNISHLQASSQLTETQDTAESPITESWPSRLPLTSRAHFRSCSSSLKITEAPLSLKLLPVQGLHYR